MKYGFDLTKSTKMFGIEIPNTFIVKTMKKYGGDATTRQIHAEWIIHCMQR